jgi:DNA-directed RNA polymerase subunit RPC12/RpoP
MLQRNSVSVGFCLNRAAECEKLAELAPDSTTKYRYRKLAAAWLRLARNASFTDRLETHLSAELWIASPYGSKVRKLKVIEAPRSGHVIDAPPAIVASDQSNHYVCGHCGTLLVVAEDDQLHGLVVRCRECGHYNAVDT